MYKAALILLLKFRLIANLTITLGFQYFAPAAAGRTRGRLFEPGKRSVCRACNFHDSQEIVTQSGMPLRVLSRRRATMERVFH